MKLNAWDTTARSLIEIGSDFVQWHMGFMTEMVRIDSRSFNVNEFEGDRTTPTDMKEILAVAEKYLRDIGFPTIRINVPPPGPERSTPILMAEIVSGADKPTLLLYAHLDKQPYMDDQHFEKWDGHSPTELRWSEDGTRAYGRGAADDLSGVVAIGMSVDALLKAIGFDAAHPAPEKLRQLPCNIKVIFETEEESGSHTLIPQILQNREFFETADCVIITDVVNPDTGIPGLTTSLRGIVQVNAHLQSAGNQAIDAQTALYKTLATLIHDDHSLAVTAIAETDVAVTEEERKGYAKIPITLEALRDQAGLLKDTQLTVPADKVDVLVAQLRTSYVNVRPGNRVAGGVVFGSAGVRFNFHTQGLIQREGLLQWLTETFRADNRFHLNLRVQEVAATDNTVTVELVVQSANKDPHSGITGGPFPVPELQLAAMVDRLIGWDGQLTATGWEPFFEPGGTISITSCNALHVEHDGSSRIFDDSSAKAFVELRLAPGQQETQAGEHLKDHLRANTPAGFTLALDEDKGGPPWMTTIEHPAFPLMLDSLKVGYDHDPCLYGCGGSIPFVAKLMAALGNIPPLCLGAYDPDCRMHEPGESLSMTDLLGCARTIVHFMLASPQAFRRK